LAILPNLIFQNTMAIQRSKNILDKPDAKKWFDSHNNIYILFCKVVKTITQHYSGSDDGYVNMAPPQYRFNKQPSGRVAVCAQANRIIVKFLPTMGENCHIFFVYDSNDFPIAIDHIKSTYRSYAGFFYASTAGTNEDIINPKLQKSILSYREHPELRLCDRAYLVTGVAKNDQFNRKLLAKNQTGRWLASGGRVNLGDAIFVLLPNANTRNGYPRELYAGIVEKRSATKGPILFTVKAFIRLPDIDAEVRKFLGGRVPPMGNTILDVWDFFSDDKKRDDEFAARVASSNNDSPESRKSRLDKAPRLPAKRIVQVERYDRNPDVVAEVLYQAQARGGNCGNCGKEAPFKRRDGTSYLEVHHKTPLASDGEDTVENAIALCPNCHRQLHYCLSST
jgi:hypothetical protein